MYSDYLLWPSTIGQQVSGQLIGLMIKLLVSQGLITIDEGNMVWILPDALIYALRHQYQINVFSRPIEAVKSLGFGAQYWNKGIEGELL